LVAPGPGASDVLKDLQGEIKSLERARIVEALERCAGNQSQAAELLGISRGTLISRLAEFGIHRPRKRPDGAGA
jgi:DNA-binding NtrC family response regulator